MSDLDDLESRLRAGSISPGESSLPDLAAGAAAAGLLDVAYATLDSPVGKLLLAATEQGLVRVAYLDSDGEPDSVLRSLAARVSPRLLEAPARLDPARRELSDYFAGARTDFDLRLDRRLMGGFARRVLAATAEVAYGQTSSYAAIAAQAGSPRGWRATGNALGSNPLPIVVPCHRVLASGGGLGGYTGGPERKRALLAIEAAGA